MRKYKTKAKDRIKWNKNTTALSKEFESIFKDFFT